MAYTINDHLEYNLWANRLIAEQLQALDEELFNRELKSSFPGIGKTVLHLWDSQIVWLRRLQGENPQQWPSVTFKGSRFDMLAGLISTSEIIKSLIDAKGPDFLNQKVFYKTMKGVDMENLVEEILYHVVNHGTYHRGQIITMLRELGITSLVNTDLIRFIRIQE
jgi:uncharacterized damage-inducible protein DinB